MQENPPVNSALAVEKIIQYKIIGKAKKPSENNKRTTIIADNNSL